MLKIVYTGQKKVGENMDPSRMYFNTLKYTILGILFIDIFYKFNKQIEIFFLISMLTVALILNDLNRIKHLKNKVKLYYTSLICSIFVTGILIFIVGGISNVVAFFTLTELIAKDDIEIKKPIIYTHAAVYFFPNIIRNRMTDGNTSVITDTFNNILIYSAVVTILFLIRSLKTEKKEIIKLNEELNKKNLKLMDYAEKVEELTVSKERNRVAQELHDSIGHSLMAISMHLDFLKNIIDTDTEKAKGILGRIDSILKESIEDLRDTVYKLKESSNKDSLESRIKVLINNVTICENINIRVVIDENIEKTSSKIKEAIFITIKESITNSLKYGAPSKIDINIKCKDDKISLVIEDDGNGCEHIVKSHGLMGIEDRISSLGGKTSFISSNKDGFRTEIIIPIIWEA